MLGAPPGVKRCRRCQLERPLDEFVRDASKASGYAGICRPCDNARSKTYYYANREAIRERNRPPLRMCKCGQPATSSRHHYCDRCRVLRDEANRHRKRTRRPGRRTGKAAGYGWRHQQLRARWKPIVEAGGVACAKCRRAIIPSTPWDLGHDRNDRSRYTGPEHASCNRATAKRIYPPRTQTERGYGWEHQKLRSRWARLVAQGGVNCARCDRPIPPGSRWELGHDDFDRTLYNGPEHYACNRNAPKRKPARV